MAFDDVASRETPVFRRSFLPPVETLQDSRHGQHGQQQQQQQQHHHQPRPNGAASGANAHLEDGNGSNAPRGGGAGWKGQPGGAPGAAEVRTRIMRGSFRKSTVEVQGCGILSSLWICYCRRRRRCGPPPPLRLLLVLLVPDLSCFRAAGLFF